MTQVPDDIQAQINSIGNSTSNIRSSLVSKGVTPSGGLNTYSSAIDLMAGGTRNLGEIITSTIPLIDSGLHLLDGTLISGSGSYSPFVSYIADLYDSGDYSDIFETEANWQSAVTTYGVCGKFVYDSVANTVRLPKITGFTEGTTDVTALGDLVEAGLPNITGKTWSVPAQTTSTGTTYGLGAFGNTITSSTKNCSSGGTSQPVIDVVIDASLSNPIYGNSSTVQPQAIKVLYYIVIATITKTEIEVDIDQIATDLNGKADTDLSNLNNSGKIALVHTTMPSDQVIKLTVGVNGAEYAAPADGYFTLMCLGQNVRMSCNYAGIHSAQGSYDSSAVVGLTIPARKGYLLELLYSSIDMSPNWAGFYFVYAVGTTSEM